MIAVSARRWIPALLFITGGLLHSQALVPEVKERILKNGIRVLMVERPGTGAVHARMFLRGGRAETGGLPPVAADLLVQGLAAAPPLEDAKAIEALLKQEQGSFEALRLEQLQAQRHGLSESSSEAQSLEAIHQTAMARLAEMEGAALKEDPFRRLGASARMTEAEADDIVWGLDLPKDSLEPWCALQAQLLGRIRLPWLPLERQRLMRERTPTRPPYSVLLGTALGATSYARVLDGPGLGLESLGWSDMVAYAQRMVVPGRIVLVLVGDFSGNAIQPCLERTLGGLSGKAEDLQNTSVPEEAAGTQRLQAYTSRERRLLMAWRIPPMAHGSLPQLKVLAELLSGDRASRLARRLMGNQPLAKSVKISVGVPGGREASLLVVEILPADEHPLGELEQAVLSEVLKLQQGSIPQDEIRRAQRAVEGAEMMIQEDAARLASALGAAQVQGGDWRLAFRGLGFGRDLSSEELRALAQRYLSPTQATTVLLEPDPLYASEDRQEARLVQLLRRVLESRISDPAHLESVARETIRQLRMVPAGDRERILRLLESQVKP